MFNYSLHIALNTIKTLHMQKLLEAQYTQGVIRQVRFPQRMKNTLPPPKLLIQPQKMKWYPCVCSTQENKVCLISLVYITH